MENTNPTTYQIDAIKPFSESLIWQLNRDYYQQTGVEAWRSGVVPHNLTSNSLVGKTYAALIFAFLKDLAAKGQTAETVYILEMGAGHGRLGFHILQHLERLVGQVKLNLPKYCYVLSDIAEDSLNFFLAHPQFQDFFEKGILDVAYFDAVESTTLDLRFSKKTIKPQTLNQPLVILANYFFDSLPMDLFYFKDKKTSTCSVSLESNENPEGMNTTTLIKNLELIYYNFPLEKPCYENPILNEIIEDYRTSVSGTYMFFPTKSFECIEHLKQLSKKGALVLSMDKGYHELHDVVKPETPEMITHGSLSFWVNYHAIGSYCKKHGGQALFPSFSTLHLELACLMFLPESDTYTDTKIAYKHFVDDFGPDDYNALKEFTYKNIARMTLPEMFSMMRLSAYDSNLFIAILPRIKQVVQQISTNERTRLAKTMYLVWEMYFSIGEPHDLAFEIGGMLYGLGFYKNALGFFDFSIHKFGAKPDIFYNKALCYYHLREDDLFLKTVKEGKSAFPDFKNFDYLDKLDLNAK